MKKGFSNRLFFIPIIVFIIICCLSACINGKEINTSVNSKETSEPLIDLTSMTGSDYSSKTDEPEIIEYRTVADGRAVFAGTCEEGATIYIEHDGKVIMSTKSHYGSFIFELSVTPQSSPMEVSVYAKAENKALSESVSGVAYYETDDPGISEWVWVGKDFRLFFSATKNNYYRNDVLDNRQEKNAKQRIAERVTWLDENLGAKPIYILVPNPNEIYGEYMPDGMVRQFETTSLHEQTVRLLNESGAVVIDMKPILEQHKNDEFAIYHHTDSHWTEYAAFFAYTELFDYISRSFDASKPRPIEDFGFRNESRQVGDLYTDLSMDETILYETSTFSNISFQTPVGIPKYKNDISTLIHEEPTKEYTFINPDSTGKPNVIILRDSYSIMMFDFIAERCATTTMRSMWDFSFDKALFTELDIDYVIYIICDMNLKNLYK
ncbi:MAG: hypothetical protein CVU97_01225 [Firmicutes bacterium HGW-Firmicutes-21]|nr:MAG: hypothetical protein CVU97_01225 [Firmicutes bacterium HGW-Firmicutes-21]